MDTTAHYWSSVLPEAQEAGEEHEASLLQAGTI